MKIFISLIVIICISSTSEAQDRHLLDSLQTAFATAKSDTTKAYILSNLSAVYLFCDTAKVLMYAEQCKALSEKINDKSGIGYYYVSVGNYQMMNSAKHDTALKLYQIALKIFESTKDQRGIAYAKQGIGAVYTYQTKYIDALRIHLEVLQISKKIGDKVCTAEGYNNIGLINTQKSNYPEALKYYYLALKTAEEVNHQTAVAIYSANISTVYTLQSNYNDALKFLSKASSINKKINNRLLLNSNLLALGFTLSSQGRYKEAIESLWEAAKICDSTNNVFLKAFCFGNLGYCYSQTGEYKQALKYSFEAVEFFNKVNYKDAISSFYETIAQVYTKQKQYKLAEKYFRKALSIASEMGSLENCKVIYSSLASFDSSRSNYKGAFHNYKLYIEYRDSVLNEENTKKTVQLQMQYEYEKKESIAKAEQEKLNIVAKEDLEHQKLLRNAFIGGFATVILFAGVFLAQRNKVKKSKKQSDALLLNILPAEVADELKAKGTADAKHFDNVTVLFTDFKNFTTVSEELSPQELVDELHACFKGFDEICTKYSIEKIKTIGDAYLAVCGLPLAYEKHAENVVNAALEIREFMKKRRENFGAKTFEIRIGINSGSVVAGIVGVKKFAYDIWGDTVNTAARMEQNSEAGKINISESTYALVKEQFTCDYRGEIDAKNKGKLKMYFVEKL